MTYDLFSYISGADIRKSKLYKGKYISRIKLIIATYLLFSLLRSWTLIMDSCNIFATYDLMIWIG
jgi:hypothetical protein